MPVTFNQIPPLHRAAPIWATEDFGDLLFSEEKKSYHSVKVWRKGDLLHMEWNDYTLCKRYRDKDDAVDVDLHAFIEFVKETLTEMSRA